MKHSYERTITDTDYSKIPEVYNSIWSYFYSDKINEFTIPITFNDLDKKYKVIANDNYLVFDIESEYKLMSWFYPIFPVLLLLAFLLPSLDSEEKISFFVWVWILAFSIIIIAILICEYKRPKKEYIFDRMNGVITFPDLAWKKNNTMPFEKVMWFIHTESASGVAKGSGYPELNIRSPKTHFYSFKNMVYFKIVGKPFSGDAQCDDELSLLTWYMDKNRPLPPGEMFDEFREKDFERRKAKGFPKPLFRYITNSYSTVSKSSHSTPESTDKQQDERERIGRW